MKWIGVITGDIVGSSEILKAGDRDKLLEVMHRTVEDLDKEKYGKITMEIQRGDSFQIVANHPCSVIEIAIYLRASLILNSRNNIRWDARLGIGIGKGEYLTDRIAESDGEAFHLAGTAFDNLSKNKNMTILTPESDLNGELLVSTTFADDIISNWTISQANIFYLYFSKNFNQKKIAEIEKKTPQTISKIHIAGKSMMIAGYMWRVAEKILELQTQQSHDNH